MKYAKLIDGYPQYAPNPIEHNGLWYGNPPGSVYEAEGYKPVIYTQPPEIQPGYIAVYGWDDDGESLRQIWTVVPEPITEGDALTRYANELTGNEDETLTEATETLIKHFKEDN
jgi:hypothetical protein